MEPATNRSNRTRNRSNPTRFIAGVCLFAFILRLLILLGTYTYREIPDDTDHFTFGWEMGRVARSLAQGQGFSSPLPLPTGPTAIVGPVYPLLLAGIFKVFGIYSLGSGLVARMLQCAFSSLTCLFVFLCGRETSGEPTGKLAAIAWAVFPLNIFFTVARVWESSLTVLLVSGLFWLMLRSRDSVSIPPWITIGALLGFGALVNTSLVALVVPFGIAGLIRHRARFILPASVGALTCLIVVSPWLIRNHAQFGKWMLRSNFPLEFRIGNNELSWGQKIESLHPSNTVSLNYYWMKVGEQRFMREYSEANAQFVASDFRRFALATANKLVNYWTGAWIRPIRGYPNVLPVIAGVSSLSLISFLGVHQMFRSGNTAAGFMYVFCFLLYPVVYYLTTTQPRFYHSISPLLIVSSAVWILKVAGKAAPVRSCAGEGMSAT